MTTAEKDLESVEEAASELRIGLGLVVFGALFVAAWFVGSDSGHGEVSLLRLPAIALLPLGAAFVLSGVALKWRLPGWRFARWLPPAVALVGLAACSGLFLL
jgi:hypothetical protein